MNTFLGLGIVGVVAVVLVALLIIALIVFFVVRGWIKVARADEALVISGKSQKNSDGTTSATTVVVNGKAVVNPITQRHEVISLRQRQVNMSADAQSNDNVTVSVEAVALVKIGSDPALVRRAAERFASQDDAIESFTQDQLEGVLRGVIAQQTVISLMRDRKVFSEQIAETVIPELREQGLILDSFQIRGITDAVGYIQSLGAPEIEAKRQAAEISQTNAERAVAKERIRNEEQNLVEKQALDTNRANAQ
ncbi:MAG TPA: flotillin family protein, partial [Brachybacterium sp.]|nr:flotillin family protein [Brachybacterium sp.]